MVVAAPEPGDSGAPKLPDSWSEQIVQAARRHDVALDELRAVICAYVDDLRTQNLSPERIIVLLKQAMSQAQVTSPPGSLLRRSETAMRDLVLEWCLDHYFGSVRRSNPNI